MYSLLLFPDYFNTVCLVLKAHHVQEERDRLRLEFNELEERVNPNFLFFLFLPSMVCGVSYSPGFSQSACTRFPFSKSCVHVCVHVCAQVFVHTYTRDPLGAHQPQLQFCVGVSDVTPALISPSRKLLFFLNCNNLSAVFVRACNFFT